MPSGCGSEGDGTVSETFSVVLDYLLRNKPRLKVLQWTLSVSI